VAETRIFWRSNRSCCAIVIRNAAARDERTMANGVLTPLLRPCSYFGDLLRRVLRQRVIFHFRYAAVRARECECVTCVSLCDAKCAPGRCYALFNALAPRVELAILAEILSPQRNYAHPNVSDHAILPSCLPYKFNFLLSIVLAAESRQVSVVDQVARGHR